MKKLIRHQDMIINGIQGKCEVFIENIGSKSDYYLFGLYFGNSRKFGLRKLRANINEAVAVDMILSYRIENDLKSKTL